MILLLLPLLLPVGAFMPPLQGQQVAPTVRQSTLLSKIDMAQINRFEHRRSVASSRRKKTETTVS
jgi:hypothetical protein